MLSYFRWLYDFAIALHFIRRNDLLLFPGNTKLKNQNQEKEAHTP
jgi:hypothetical protein